MDDLCGQAPIRISGPSGLLAAVPSTLGFHPTDSLVMMCFAGRGHELGPVARVDLPGGRDPDLVGYLTGTALTHADCVALVCYPRRRRRPAVLDDLIDELNRAGVGVMTALIVHAGRVWEAPSARPLRLKDSLRVPGPDDPAVQALAAANALTGRAVLADREQLRASIAGPRGGRRRVADQAFTAVARGHRTPLSGRATDPSADPLGPLRAGIDGAAQVVPLPDRIDRVIDCALSQVTAAGTVDVELAAELATACLEQPIRDVVLLRGVFELDRAWLSMLISCATWTPDTRAAGICAILAVIAYRHGDGALAQVSADRCLLAEPDNQLTHLLIATMSAGMPPDVLDGILMPLDSPEFDRPEFDRPEFGSHRFDPDGVGHDDGNAVA